MSSLVRFLKFLAVGFVCTTLVGVGQYFGAGILSDGPFLSLLIVILAVVFWSLFRPSDFSDLIFRRAFFPREASALRPQKAVSSIIPIIILTLIVAWLFPGLVLYWVFQPRDIKWSIQITSFVVSTAGAVVFCIFRPGA